MKPKGAKGVLKVADESVSQNGRIPPFRHRRAGGDLEAPLSVPGYDIESRIYEGQRSLVYRARRRFDQRMVVLKMLRSDYPTARDLARLRHEFSINRHLYESGVTGIVEALAVEEFDNHVVLVLEDFGGVTLYEQTNFRRMSPLELVRAFATVAHTLGRIHAAGVLHKDIKPQNMITSRDTAKVCLTDFGIASRLDRERQGIVAPSRLEGTLAYMAPEQTGRVNRPIDARSDLYALGATMYECFTRRRPFMATDPMELVHAHIAVEPEPPRSHEPELPGVINHIIIKLLAKSAQDRYQSAGGLAIDLDRCGDQLEARGVIDRFDLATQDIPTRFVLPECVHGRDREASELLSAFERVADSRCEIVSVSGYSGIGKSSLIHEIKRPVTERRGYFLVGKVDAGRRGLPYAPVQEALGSMVQQWLAESDSSVDAWSQRLREALGEGSDALLELVPGLIHLVGAPQNRHELASAEVQNRLHGAVSDFLAIAARADHPVALVLDDMQWSDEPTLKLLDRIATDPSLGHLMIVLSFRDNEVGASHPLKVLLDDIQGRGATVRHIHLGPLNSSALTQIVSEALHCTPTRAAPLAELIGDRTGGNPYFFGEILRALHRDGLIDIDPIHGWQWSLEAIAAHSGYAENVVDMMTQRMAQLDAPLQRALALSALFGSRVRLDEVARLHGDPLRLAQLLGQAVQEGLLLPMDEDWKLAMLEGAQLASPLAASASTAPPTRPLRPAASTSAKAAWDGFHVSQGSQAQGEQSPAAQASASRAAAVAERVEGPVAPQYRFAHDRVQQAAYETLALDDRKLLHLDIARNLASRFAPSVQDDRSFETMSHYRLAQDLVTDASERYRVANVAFAAGRRARRAAAWQSAIDYLSTGMLLLGDQRWRDSEGLSVGIALGLSECFYICGQHDEAEALFNETLANVDRDLDRAAVFQLRMVLYGNIVRYADAIDCGRQALQMCQIDFRTDVNKFHVIREVLRTRWLMRNRSVDSLEFLPELGEPRMQVAVRVLNAMAAPAYFLDPNLYTLLVLRMLNISLEYGNSDVAPYSYALYGMIAGSVLGDFKVGMEFGDLAVRLQRRYGNPDTVAKVQMITGNFVNPWRNPVRTNLEYLRSGYREGRAAGDLVYAGYCGVCIAYALFTAGEPLDSLYRESHRYLEFIRTTGDSDSAQTFIIEQRMVLAAQGLTHSLSSFGDSSFDEDAYLIDLRSRKMKIPLVLYAVARLRLLALLEKPVEMLRWIDEVLPHEAAVLGMPWSPELDLYVAVAVAMAEDPKFGITSIPGGLFRRRRQAARARRRLARFAENSPANYHHKFELARALWLRGRGKVNEATIAFENATAAARRYGVLHDEALASLCAARHHEANSQKRIARALLQDVRYALSRWGATGIVQHLEDLNPDLRLLLEEEVSEAGSFTSASGTTSTGGGHSLDLTTVMKASQVISSEIVLERLLRLLLGVLIENAGARRGVLVLQRKGELLVEAEGNAAGSIDGYEVLQSRPLDSSTLSVSVVRYVARTHEPIVIRDASEISDVVASRFQHDPYFGNNRPRSTLAAPILHMQDLIGVLYLENNLNAGVFTNDRLELIQMLSAQIAISIQNAELYRRQAEMARSMARFVPVAFLDVLGKPSIVEVELGEAVERDMTVLFSDIRSFTRISESMVPQEIFRFLNAYLGRIGPVVRHHRGFVDKYIGDAVMALFPHSVEDALDAAIALQRHVANFNAERAGTGTPSLQIGVGLHFGTLMLGTIGEAERIEGTVISDAVNISSRLEGMTKLLGASILVSRTALERVQDRHRFAGRALGAHRIRGRIEALEVVEIIGADPPSLRAHKLGTADAFAAAVALREAGRHVEARAAFAVIAGGHPDDVPAAIAAGLIDVDS